MTTPTIVFSPGLKHARAMTIRDYIDSGTGTGVHGAKLQIWTGVCPSDMPLNPTDNSYTLLGEVMLAQTASTVDANTLSLNIAGMTAGEVSTGGGTAGWARILTDADANNSRTIVMDLSIGDMASSHPIKMANLVLTAGTPLNIATFYITEN
jgi:hypothetical protein